LFFEQVTNIVNLNLSFLEKKEKQIDVKHLLLLVKPYKKSMFLLIFEEIYITIL